MAAASRGIEGYMGAYSSLMWHMLVQAMIVGSLAGVVVGATLLFYPNAEVTLERFTNKWVSSRRVVRNWDDMNLTLDLLFEAHPAPAGWLLACTSAAAVLCAVFMLVRYY
jgi:hypothetical protein